MVYEWGYLPICTDSSGVSKCFGAVTWPQYFNCCRFCKSTMCVTSLDGLRRRYWLHSSARAKQHPRSPFERLRARVISHGFPDDSLWMPFHEMNGGRRRGGYTRQMIVLGLSCALFFKYCTCSTIMAQTLQVFFCTPPWKLFSLKYRVCTAQPYLRAVSSGLRLCYDSSLFS